MKSKGLILLTAAMPLLLAWVVVIGEINRLADSSPPVHVRMKAERIHETAFTAPMLTLQHDFRGPAGVPPGFSVGQDVLLRYVRKADGWMYERVHKKSDGQSWSPSAIDIPARVVVHNTEGDAEPLLPSRFAISRATMNQMRQETLLDVTLRKGALGTVWAERADEAALPLGAIVGLLPGTPVMVVGSFTEPLQYGRPDARGGWIAPIEGDAIGKASNISGQPIAAVHVGPAVMVAVDHRGMLRFSVESGARRTLHEGQFLSFDPDGSFWGIQNDPFPRGEHKKLVKWRADGTLDFAIPLQNEITEASQNAAAAVIGYEVRRFTIDHGAMTLADRWQIEGLTTICMANANRIVAIGKSGVFLLTAGEQSPVKIFEGEAKGIACTSEGEVLVVATDPAKLRFRATDGREIELLRNDVSPEFIHLTRVGDQVYVASLSAVDIFDAKSGRLLHHITDRRLTTPHRVF